MQHIKATLAVAAIASAFALSLPAFGHGDAKHESSEGTKKSTPAEQTAFGIAGDPAKVSRTIDMEALDTFRFTPDKISVKRGETIRFVMRNTGKIQHEIVIGTMKELEEHAELMKKFPEMEHEGANMAHVAPGQSGEIVWTFNRPGSFNFACLIAGHFEAGMIGTVVVS